MASICTVLAVRVETVRQSTFNHNVNARTSLRLLTLLARRQIDLTFALLLHKRQKSFPGFEGRLKKKHLYLNIDPHIIFMGFGPPGINVGSCILSSMKNKP